MVELEVRAVKIHLSARKPGDDGAIPVRACEDADSERYFGCMAADTACRCCKTE